MDCRICLEKIEDNCITNLCKCKNVYFHETCAIKWYSPKIYGKSYGKAIDDVWKTEWYASCEVCNNKIDLTFVNKCLFLVRTDFQLKKCKKF